MTRNPWAKTEAQAIAEEDALLDQAIAETRGAHRRFVSEEQVDEYLDWQFAAVREALRRAAYRRFGKL